MNDFLERYLNRERIVQIALVCAIFVFLPKIVTLLFVIVKLLPFEITKCVVPNLVVVSTSDTINSVADFVSALANAFAVFVTVLGLLSFLDRVAEEENKKLLEKSEKPTETIKVRQASSLKDIFIDAAKEDVEIVNKTIECLKNHDIDSNGLNRENLPFERFYDALQDRLVNCGAVIVLCYTPPNSWIKERLRLYTRLGIIGKVIVYTGKTTSEVNELLVGMRKRPMIVCSEVSKEPNCGELATKIDNLITSKP